MINNYFLFHKSCPLKKYQNNNNFGIRSRSSIRSSITQMPFYVHLRLSSEKKNKTKPSNLKKALFPRLLDDAKHVLLLFFFHFLIPFFCFKLFVRCPSFWLSVCYFHFFATPLNELSCQLGTPCPRGKKLKRQILTLFF